MALDHLETLGLGQGDHRLPGHGDGPCLIHNRSYDFNDDILAIGASYFVRLVERWLAVTQETSP